MGEEGSHIARKNLKMSDLVLSYISLQTINKSARLVSVLHSFFIAVMTGQFFHGWGDRQMQQKCGFTEEHWKFHERISS